MRTALLVAFSMAALGLAGCTDDVSFDANRSFKETGKTVHLKATVVDYMDHEVYPGFKANLWAFCIEAFDPNDEYSVAAVEYREVLPTDGRVGDPNGPQKKECGVPAPTIRVKQGDRVIVEFAHSHFHPHTIHWHGQFVDWDHDGAPGVSQDSIKPGGSITYDFIAKRAGTLWYHCHVDTQLHVMRGLYGAFIVEPQDESHEPKDIDKEYTLVLGTFTRHLIEAVPGRGAHNHTGTCASGFQDCMNPAWDVTPDTWVINGRSYPNTMGDPATLIEVQPGDRVRLRLINVGETVETMHPHGHDMYVTHRDGNPLPKGARFWVDTLSIGPAERYDVVIEADNPGPWMFHTHVNSHETNCGRAPGGMHTMIVYEGHNMHGFKAELPAACDYETPFGLATDKAFVEIFNLQTGSSLPGVQPLDVKRDLFTIPQECSIQRVGFDARLELENDALVAFTEVEIIVSHPDLGEIARVPIGGDAGLNATWQMDIADMVKLTNGQIGALEKTYPVRVTGSSLGGNLVLQGEVLHYDSILQTLEAHELFKVANCPGAERA